MSWHRLCSWHAEAKPPSGGWLVDRALAGLTLVSGLAAIAYGTWLALGHP